MADPQPTPTPASRTGPLAWLAFARRQPPFPGADSVSEAEPTTSGGPPSPTLGWVHLGEETATGFRPGPEDFRAPDLLKVLPRDVREELQLGNRERPTFVQALSLLLAPPWWLVETRAHLFSPLSPSLGLLRSLIDAFGLGLEQHEGDHRVLPQLLAALPSWLPERGELRQAVALLESVWPGRVRSLVRGANFPTSDSSTSEDRIGTRARSETDPPTADFPSVCLNAEVLVCRSLDWYAWRSRGGPPGQCLWVIRDGAVHVSSLLSRAFPLTQEDLGVRAELAQAWLPGLLRLLPVWTALRPETEGVAPDGEVLETLEDCSPDDDDSPWLGSSPDQSSGVEP